MPPLRCQCHSNAAAWHSTFLDASCYCTKPQSARRIISIKYVPMLFLLQLRKYLPRVGSSPSHTGATAVMCPCDQTLRHADVWSLKLRPLGRYRDARWLAGQETGWASRLVQIWSRAEKRNFQCVARIFFGASDGGHVDKLSALSCLHENRAVNVIPGHSCAIDKELFSNVGY
jgi:hypothetical protein